MPIEQPAIAAVLMLVSAAPFAAAPLQSGPEVIGPWTIVQTPASARLVGSAGGSWGWLNVVNNPVTVNDAFSGFNLIDDGFANGPAGTTIEVTFSPAVLNGPGPDLVLFDAQFDQGAYDVSTDSDGFTSILSLPIFVFSDTLVMPAYYYEMAGGTYPAAVFAASIDLSAVGVPSGATVSKVRMTLTNGGGDLLGIGVTCIALAATEVVRLGTPPNPPALAPGITSGPAIGATWDPFIDHTAFVPAAVVDLLGVTVTPVNLPAPPFGTLLCNLFTQVLLVPGTPGIPFAVVIPNDCALIGVTLCAQAASLDAGSTVALTNALDLTIGSF